MHAEGLEDVGVSPLPERLTRHPTDELRQQVVARVGVQVLRAGVEVQVPLVPHHPQDLIERDHVVHAPPAHRKRARPVTDPADVVNQVVYGDGMPEVRDLGDVPPDIVIE